MSVPHNAEATSISLGFINWYSGWIEGKKINSYPSFIQTEYIYIPYDNNNKLKIKPNCMYGPSINVDLAYGISFYSRLLFGEFSANKNNDFFMYYLIIDNVGKIKRYDTDLILRYAPIDLVSFFVGFKYSHQQNIIVSYSRSIGIFIAAAKKEIKNQSNEYIPLLGIGVKVPAIKKTLSINIDAAFLFCLAYIKTRQYFFSRTEMTSNINILPPCPLKSSINKIGIDTHFDFVYHIPVFPVNISLGFRYQMLKILAYETIEDYKSMLYEHRYGMTASVDYIFTF